MSLLSGLPYADEGALGPLGAEGKEGGRYTPPEEGPDPELEGGGGPL